VWLKRSHSPQYIGDDICLAASLVKSGVVKQVNGTDELAWAIWKPAAITRGGPSKRVQWASLTETGINGPW